MKKFDAFSVETVPDGATVRAARQRLGLTQRGLARVLRMRGAEAWQTVSGWERGERPITGPAWTCIEMLLSGGRPATWTATDGHDGDRRD